MCTQIDVFEQQLNSISKIDCMERYLNEVNIQTHTESDIISGVIQTPTITQNSLSLQKDYLIIIIISLRYYETISGINISMDSDERTSNTVYIHRQVNK